MFITHSPSHYSMLYTTPMHNCQINKTQIYEKWVSSDAINLHRMTIIMRVLWSTITFLNLYFSRFLLCKPTWCRLHATHSCLLPQCYFPGVCVCVCVCAVRGWELNFLDLQVLARTIYIAFCHVIIISVHRTTAEMWLLSCVEVNRRLKIATLHHALRSSAHRVL
jgi:hypothetical protein